MRGFVALTCIKITKWLSSQIQEFPNLWKFCVKISGPRRFDPIKVTIKRTMPSEVTGTPIKNKYFVVFDAQCLQSPTIHRGIGRYSLNLIEAVCQARPQERFAAILTTTCSYSEFRDAELCLRSLNSPNLDILVFDPFSSRKKTSLKEAQEVFSQYVQATNCQAYISLSSFEKQHRVIPLSRRINGKRIAILYDLLRLEFQNDLLISKYQKTSFASSLSNLKEFDLLLSISKTTQLSWNKHVESQVPVKVIYGAGCTASQDATRSLRDRVGILCVGAEQPHKNLERLILAYGRLPTEVQSKHKLSIVGIRSVGVRRRLTKFSERKRIKVEILGHVNEKVLLDLYGTSRLLVVPSLAEGLSLPILEAWSQGLVAIGGRNTVAEELMRNEELLFDPYDTDSLSKCIENLLTSDLIWQKALNDALFQSCNFTWKRVAVRTLNSIQEVLNVKTE